MDVVGRKGTNFPAAHRTKGGQQDSNLKL